MRFIVLIGILVHFYSGSTTLVINNGFLTLRMDKWALLAHPFFVFAIFHAIRTEPLATQVIAPWWRGMLAFFVDFFTAISLFGIPMCFIALLVENQGLPQVWFITKELSPNQNLIYSALVIPGILLTIAAFGSFVHPKIVSPGQLLANVSVTRKVWTSNSDIMMFGFLTYFSVAFPFMKHFFIFSKEAEQLEPKTVLRSI